MRRGVGIGAISKKTLQQAKFEQKATEISENEMNQLIKQIETFKSNLQVFAVKYKDEIRTNTQFRKQFQDMCGNIGVDPLASSKGFWSEMLGVSDFYYELAVQIIETCNSMQERTGGLVYLDQILARIQKMRSAYVAEVTLDDCRRAIKKLNIFGNSFTLIKMHNGRDIVQSVPEGLGQDHTQVLQLAETHAGVVTSQLVTDELKWDKHRIDNVLSFLVKEGIVWVDLHTVTSFYFPSLLSGV